MDSFDLDSNASLDSLHLSSEDFSPPSPLPPSPLPHSSTPDPSKRLYDLESELDKLRLALETSKSELDFFKSSNTALKTKITELFQEAQHSLQETLKLQNTLKDRDCQLAILENSSKWYQARLHQSEATNKSLMTDLEAYQKILHQREEAIADYIDKHEKTQNLKIKFQQMAVLHQMESDNLREELSFMKNQNTSASSDCEIGREEVVELRKRIEEISRDLEIAEKRYLNAEICRGLEAKSVVGLKKEVEKMRGEVGGMEVERDEAVEKLRVVQGHAEDLRIENERLSVVLLASRKEKVEVEEGIVQLRIQLMKMIAQYKAMKARNLETERLVGRERERVREGEVERRRIKARSLAASKVLMRKVEEERRRADAGEEALREERAKAIINCQKGETVNSMTICLRQALNREKDLRDRLKLLSKSSDESVDEGYGDSAGFPETPLSSPSPLNSGLMNFALNVLIRSQNFMEPVNSSLNELEVKLEKISVGLGSTCVKCR